MRPSNDPAKSSSIPPSPDIRKSSPIRRIPARSSSSPIRRSATTAPAQKTTNPRSRTSKGWSCASFRRIASNWRSDEEAEQFLAEHGIPVVSEIDTRALVRHLRTRGVMRGVLSAIETRSPRSWSRRRATFPPWPASIWPAASPPASAIDWTKPVDAVLAVGTGARRPAEPRYHVVAYDFGIKQQILRRLVQVGCRVTVVPAADLRRRRARAEARRRVSLQRPRRSRAAATRRSPTFAS